jgi:hypothetical protein
MKKVKRLKLTLIFQMHYFEPTEIGIKDVKPISFWHTHAHTRTHTHTHAHTRTHTHARTHSFSFLSHRFKRGSLKNSTIFCLTLLQRTEKLQSYLFYYVIFVCFNSLWLNNKFVIKVLTLSQSSLCSKI